MTHYNERRPGLGTEATKDATGDGESFLQCIPVQLRSYVAEKVNAARGEIPDFGSTAWFLLPVDDPKREAAMAIAALGSFVDRQPAVIAVNLANQLLGEQMAAKRREDEDFRAHADAHRARYGGRHRAGRYAKSNEEFLARRQAQLAAEDVSDA